ncbi:MAG: DUF58 domain-containing protein [Saprospirales bacterium]|nr:DUF58 domain-containing protein [Saprospirales bacterium]
MNILDQYELQDFGNLELLARQVVEGFIIGLHKSPFHGFSVEFAEQRLYNQGESTRDIDWKVYARTDKLFVKKFEEETNLRCQIVVDASSSMYFPDAASVNKLRFSALAAASLMNLLKRQRDAFGLSVFDEDVRTHTLCKSSTMHSRLLLSYLQALIDHPAENRATATAKALHTVAESIHKRSLVIIFSDMLEQSENLESIFSALQHLKYNKHEVVLFHVVDQSKEVDFEYENRPYLFIDLESGEKVRLQSNQVKEHYVKQMKSYKEALKVKCLQYKIDFVEADINQGYKKILQSYLVKRSRMGA